MPISNALEDRFAKVDLHLSLADRQACVDAAIGPVIVGEAPGDNTSAHLPMFPWPRGSAGGRLLTISKMSALDYLRTFHRINLMPTPRGWGAAQARVAVHDVLLKYGGHPLVLLGSKVCAAFGRGVDVGVPALLSNGCWTIPVPHPSGRNLVVNEDAMRERMRAALWLAVDLWVNPRGPYTREVCSPCGRLVSAHPVHPGDPTLRVMCAGDTMRFCYPRTTHDV